MKDWQEGLRALLPNINIHFGASPYRTTTNGSHGNHQPNTATAAAAAPPTRQTSHTQHTRNGTCHKTPVLRVHSHLRFIRRELLHELFAK